MTKYSSLISMLAFANAKSYEDNSTPVMPTQPGWQIGTVGGNGSNIEVRMFYDLLCPASRSHHQFLLQFLDTSIPNSSRKYRDVMSFKITPVVLPYHLHSFQVTQLVPFLFDVCESTGKCHMDDYAILSWTNLETIVKDNTTNEVDFMKDWSAKVVA